MTTKIETTETRFDIKINGTILTVDFGLMHPTWVEAHLRKAAQRFMNDKFSGLTPAEKLAEARKMVAEIHSGEEMPVKVSAGGGSTPVDPVEALAMKNAKSDLTAIFKSVTGETKIADMARHEKVAQFFNETENGFIWKNASVTAWMEKQAKDGKRDYMADAKASLAQASDAELDF